MMQTDVEYLIAHQKEEKLLGQEKDNEEQNNKDPLEWIRKEGLTLDLLIKYLYLIKSLSILNFGKLLLQYFFNTNIFSPLYYI